MNSNKRVVVAMSGGVDSSVAAALLKQQGYEVIGMMLRLWSEPNAENSNRCCTPDAMAQARRVAAMLDIPFYTVDAKEIFHQNVVQFFINGYAQGVTPNPCLVCNNTVRWSYLLDRALAFDAQFLATGHYARLAYPQKGQTLLLKAIDNQKDQSYVLHILDQKRLSHALFPLGDLTKASVRAIAHDFNLPVAERKDSQDLCFLGDGNYQDFLKRNHTASIHPGPIISADGKILGEHQGLAFYTIGQRKGLGISSSEPFFVIEKDVKTNSLIIGNKKDTLRLVLVAGNTHWVSGEAPVSSVRAQIKIRYKAPEVWGMVSPLDNGQIRIEFDDPVVDITPGQAAVIYNGDVCLGGGIILYSPG
jgi:tRNA-specific 2-thiouridylase